MERKVTKLEHCHTEVVVNVDKDLWKKAQDKAFNKLAANVTVPGFRKGKAPINMVKGRVDQMKVFNEAITRMMSLGVKLKFLRLRAAPPCCFWLN